MNVSKRLAELADVKSNETAIICGEQQCTYKALNTRAAALAEYLMGQGLGKQDNLAVILPNCVEFALVYFAAAKIGATFTPIDNRLGARQIDAILKDTGARVCFVFSGFTQQHSLSHPVRVIDVEGEAFSAIMQKPPASDDITAEIDPADTALYLHTSGTTGRPKIVELSYANLHCFPEAMKGCTIQGEAEVLGIILPMSHISGPIILNLLLANRCRLVIIDSINPLSLFENIAKHKITYFHAVPPIFKVMLQSGFADRYDTESLDLIAMMGTSVPISLMNAFKKTFPHVVVLQGYGLTETSPLITLTRREDADDKRASIGTPVKGAEIRVVDEQDNQVRMGGIGELAVRGPMVMKGYLGIGERENERFKNGYFYTGDLVKCDRDNYFYHMGRRDDLVILANGQNVYPAEITNVIFSHPGVLDSEVIGVYSAKARGMVLHAYVVPTQTGMLTEKDIRGLCQKELGAIKTPRYIHLMESIPKTSTGKTDLKQLRKLSKADEPQGVGR